MKAFKTALALALAGAALLAASAASAQETYDPDRLRVALLPDENAATVIQDNRPFAAYPEKTLGKDIELIVTTDYSSMIEAARFGRVDLAYFGPASYTIAKDRMAGGEVDIEPFAARVRDGATTYQSVIVANRESELETIADMKGRDLEVAFGDQASTSSHFAPKYTMMQKGVMPEDYNENFTGAHDAVARNVERGNAMVGGLSRPIFESLIARGIVEEENFVVLGYSDPLPQYPWVMRTDLDPALKARIREAFFSLEPGTEEGDRVLGPFKADGFAAITDADYDVIRAIRENVTGG